MRTPKSADVLKVINVFKKVLPLAAHDHQLDMKEAAVNIDRTCGTIHCHAGWFAVGACDVENSYINFWNGRLKMEEYLKFEDGKLLKWAVKNPKLWGNKFGGGIYSGKEAFINPVRRPKGANNLQDIVDHWQEVYTRLRKRERNIFRRIFKLLKTK